MRKPYQAVVACMLAIALAGCEKQDLSPALLRQDIQSAVQGKWALERIDYSLCRNNNCSTTTYTGTGLDYFEFRADSAFLVKNGIPNASSVKEKYKIEYTIAGGFELKASGWSGRFTVRDLNARSMVLVTSFTGRDPDALFTDTYYLKR
ncbi:hypothetical protein [Pontibacter vulgaris]|uniref:hypothetical protein n=1 Tax=Pontibacter vulgaris TaxID=2905679 RepID=UPI001FA7E59A|nr:hypothetical protein [Pontibacter vulgaris]